MINTRDYITAAELARRWGVSRQYVHALAKRGRIPSVVLFGRRLVPRLTRRPGETRENARKTR